MNKKLDFIFENRTAESREVGLAFFKDVFENVTTLELIPVLEDDEIYPWEAEHLCEGIFEKSGEKIIVLSVYALNLIAERVVFLRRLANICANLEE